MAILTVRNVPDDVHRALRVRVGDALAGIGRRIGLTDKDLAVFDSVRDKTPAKPLTFD